jgi:hypothetical protein
MMTEVFVERLWDEPLSDQVMRSMIERASDCLGLHRVTRNWSMLAAGGHQSFCHFSAPDAESVRIALEIASNPRDNLWVGKVYDMADVGETDQSAVNVLTWREFAVATEFPQIRQLHRDLCRRHDVIHVQSIQAASQLRLVDLYRARGNESVLAAFEEAGLTVERSLVARRWAA